MTPPGGRHGDDAARWDHIACHLTGAHGTNPRAIESYAPTLGQLEREHWTAHLTGDATGLMFQHSHQPHSHAEPLPEGQQYRAPDSYAPFPPSPTWQAADPWALAGRDAIPGPARSEPRIPGGPKETSATALRGDWRQAQLLEAAPGDAEIEAS
jgi:hypothetical protein